MRPFIPYPASCMHHVVMELLFQRNYYRQQQHYSRHDVQADDAGDSLLMHPLLAGLPPALHDLCMPAAEVALVSPSKSKARKSKAPAQEEAEEDQIEATAPEQDHFDAPEAPADMHDLPMGTPSPICKVLFMRACRYTIYRDMPQHGQWVSSIPPGNILHMGALFLRLVC